MHSITAFVRPVPDISRTVTWLAAFVALAALPSFVYRLPMAVGYPMGFSEVFMQNLHAPGWGSLYVVALGLLTECCGLLCLGLVRSWGERWPDWLPTLAGRPIPVPLVAVPALFGASALTAFGAGYVYTSVTADGDGPTGILEALMHLSYAPMVAWGPALFLLVGHYVRRRRSKAWVGPTPRRQQLPASWALASNDAGGGDR